MASTGQATDISRQAPRRCFLWSFISWLWGFSWSTHWEEHIHNTGFVSRNRTSTIEYTKSMWDKYSGSDSNKLHSIMHQLWVVSYMNAILYHSLFRSRHIHKTLQCAKQTLCRTKMRKDEKWPRIYKNMPLGLLICFWSKRQFCYKVLENLGYHKSHIVTEKGKSSPL